MSIPRPVIVLGASVHHGVPSRSLLRRLEAAVEPGQAAIERGDVVIVTGRGEAETMAQWLQRAGLAAEGIMVENEARSTNENLERVHQIVVEHYGTDTVQLVVVSNYFHIARIQMWAWHHDYAVTTIGCRTPLPTAVWLYLREVGALCHSAARIFWRRTVSFLSRLP